MTTSSEHVDPLAHSEVADMTLQTEEAKATAAEITADNAALEESYQSAEAEAAATTEQAQQLEEVLEEIQEEAEKA
jgi:hypothetical protein